MYYRIHMNMLLIFKDVQIMAQDSNSVRKTVTSDHSVLHTASYTKLSISLASQYATDIDNL